MCVVVHVGCGHVHVGRVLVPLDDNPYGRDAALACIRVCAVSTKSEGEDWAACLAGCPAAAEEELACPGPGSSSRAACAVLEVPVDVGAQVAEVALAVADALATSPGPPRHHPDRAPARARARAR